MSHSVLPFYTVLPVLQFWAAVVITRVNVRVVVRLSFILKSAFLYCRVYLGNASANKSYCWSGAGC